MSQIEKKGSLISSDTYQKIDQWLAKFPADKRQSALIPALNIVQEECGSGSLSTELMDEVAGYIGISEIAVYEVASFYSMYELKPIGRNMVAVCTNISCMLCGGEEIVQHVEEKYGVKIGETTADGKFTLKQEEECLAACTGAPMMTVNGHYHEKLTLEKVDSIIEGLK
ncbi:NADH-ubiquinone oxidoreductase chain E [hydrothermal vent metagenome]|uniref:NADH-ubiquinone oxidoreductase chain E n=1 Tax=hydrothermal vent metagenome TaxID=652676 RepID=A0A3B0YZN1_9ZZZZ